MAWRNPMRWLWLVLLLTGIGLNLPSMTDAAPGDGIVGTAHDFSGKVAGMGACTFCHTPHSAQETVQAWNRSLSPQTFTWDKRSTAAGTIYPAIRRDTYKGPTAKCLGC